MYQNLFITQNIKPKLNRVILEILQGLEVRENEQKLNELRKKSDYPLTLCLILAQSTNIPFMSVNTFEENKKSLIALQIKKMASRMRNEQQWRLMREVYYSECDKKIAALIRQTCLLYRAEDKNYDLMYLFFDVDLINKGIKGVVRYLTFLHEVIRQQSRQENSTLKEYGEDIVRKLLEMIQWDLGEFWYESILACLILLQGLMVKKQCWVDTTLWNGIMDKLISQRRSILITCLAKHFRQQINTDTISSHQLNKFQATEITQALQFCLQKTSSCNLQVQERFYFDCIQIIGLYWVKSIRKIINNQQFNQSCILLLDVIQTYSEYFTAKQAQNQHIIDFSQQQQDMGEIQNIFMTKKLSFLKTLLYMYPQEKLFTLIESRTNYAIQIMQFSLYLPCLTRDGFISIQTLQTLMVNLESALNQQADTHMFVIEKSTFIWTLLQYIVKFHNRFQRQMILKICYLVDFLVFKCDTTAKEGFEILDFLTQKIMDIEGDLLQEFLITTLTHVNQNQWLKSDICYFHAINILLNLNTELVFQMPQQISYNYQFSLKEKEILKMVKKMISILKDEFNYENMHKLNALFQYILQPCGIHLVQSLRYDEILWVVSTNFKYQILTDASEDVYFYFIQFSENRLGMLQNLDQYDFWKQCESERLNFFVKIYIKLIDSKENFFTSSQAQMKVIKLRKNLWERYLHEKDDDERQKMFSIFARNEKYFGELYVMAYQAQQWGENRKEYWKSPLVRGENQLREKMEIQ